jgi:eukaryotic-like serine/threonine-protein kinase
MALATSVEPLELADVLGQVIAQRYRVDTMLGVGGMGAVFRCHHLALGRDVAIKVLHPEICDAGEAAARFAREALSASRLDHTNCVRVLDFGSWHDRRGRPAKYLCMELLCGFELARLLEGQLALPHVLALVGQMLDGLEHAHSRGVVHRDVKPRNVVIVASHGGEDVVKLVDFGTAKILTGDGAAARLTREGTVCGTPHYMSPEQVAGGAVDGRADLYALGVLLHRMLSGRLPFDAQDSGRVMQMQLFDDPPPLPPRLPERLRKFGAQLLAKDRNHRHPSAAAARRELDAIIVERRRASQSLEAVELAEALGASATARSAARRRVAIRSSCAQDDHPTRPTGIHPTVADAISPPASAAPEAPVHPPSPRNPRH